MLLKMSSFGITWIVIDTITLQYHEIHMLNKTSCNISNKRDSISSAYPNTEKRVENTTLSGVFLTKFEVFG